MSKAKTNALDALRALIAERQQYEQWLSTLEAKREAAPEHVLERVREDYVGRLDRVVGEIRGHSEELQLSISTLSSRLVEVAREEDTRREGLQEAELRAAVGEYEPEQWHALKSEAEASLEKIAADRESLDNQLSELRAIQKLSEASGPATSSNASTTAEIPIEVSRSAEPAPRASEPPTSSVPPDAKPSPDTAQSGAQSGGHRAGTAAQARVPVEEPKAAPAPAPSGNSAAAPTPATPPGERLPLEPVADAASSFAASGQRPRGTKSPPGGVAAVRAKSEAVRTDAAKTLKCPECGTPNYPTEWYCERCGGELATM